MHGQITATSIVYASCHFSIEFLSSSSVQSFVYPSEKQIPVTQNGDPNQLLAPNNIYDAVTNSGFFIRRDSNENDQFDSRASIGAAYVSEEFRPTEWFTAIAGLRFEQFNLFYTGQDQQGNIFDDQEILNKSDLFPSLKGR